MKASEIKLDLFRKIDNLDDTEVERIYSPILNILESQKEYIPTPAEKKAIYQAMDQEKNNRLKSHQQVMEEAKKRYSNLDFNE